MICTGNYDKCKGTLYKTYLISGDDNKSLYTGRIYPQLAPKKELLGAWERNTKNDFDGENEKWFIRQYYDHVLGHLDPETIYKEVDNSILLSYDDNIRHIVSAWFELFLDVEIDEIETKVVSMNKVEKPTWIKDYLEDYIKERINMKHFNSLRALYLFEEGNRLDEQGYGQQAAYRRSEADEAEEKYLMEHPEKVKSHYYRSIPSTIIRN